MLEEERQFVVFEIGGLFAFWSRALRRGQLS
jgi:hypothetical protein